MALYLVGETIDGRAPTGVHKHLKSQLTRGVYIARADGDAEPLRYAVRIAHYLYPQAYLSSTSALTLGPTSDGRLFLSGRRNQRTRLRALEIVQNAAPTRASTITAIVADELGELRIEVASPRQRFLEAFRLRSEHASAIAPELRKQMAERLIEEHGSARAAADALWTLARENQWYREGARDIERRRRRPRDPAAARVVRLADRQWRQAPEESGRAAHRPTRHQDVHVGALRAALRRCQHPRVPKPRGRSYGAQAQRSRRPSRRRPLRGRRQNHGHHQHGCQDRLPRARRATRRDHAEATPPSHKPRRRCSTRWSTSSNPQLSSRWRDLVGRRVGSLRHSSRGAHALWPGRRSTKYEIISNIWTHLRSHSDNPRFDRILSGRWMMPAGSGGSSTPAYARSRRTSLRCC
jgi:hypothetical protein